MVSRSYVKKVLTKALNWHKVRQYLWEMDMEDKAFQTTDFTLAAFLYAKGVLLVDIIDNPNDYKRKVFVFADPPPEVLSLFQSGKAEINVLAYNNAQNTLRNLVRVSR